MPELRVVPDEESEELDAGSPALRYFGSELKRYREAAGLTQAQLSGAIPYSKSMISMVETAKRSPLDVREGDRATSRFAEHCDRELETGGALSRMLPLLESDNDPSPYPSWFRPYAHLEAEARTIYKYDSQTIPGLLQTEAYAGALTRCLFPEPGADEVAKIVDARMRRQRVLDRKTPPQRFFVADEAVLKRSIGGAAVMREQYRRLIDAMRIPAVNLLVVPFEEGGHPAIDGSYTVLDLPTGDSALYVEGPGSAMITTATPEVRKAQLRFIALCGTALSPSRSAGLIEKYMGEV